MKESDTAGGAAAEAGDDTVWRLGLAEFRDRTASAEPTPGGGSAAMVSAAIGVGLVLMALRVTANRGDVDPAALDPLIVAGERRLAELSTYADADITVFRTYMAALKLPKGTDAEVAVRRNALQQATAAAAEVPLNAAQAALEGLDIARQAAPLAHKHIVSDVGAGAALLHGAIRASLMTVDANLPSLKDPDLVTEYRTSRDHLSAAADHRFTAITARVAATLAAT